MRPDRANPDTEYNACRRASQSQAHSPAARRSARTAKPQGRIPEHEASFQTRGPHRSRRRREQEPRISRANQKIPHCRNGRALMHPSRPLGAGLGRGSPSGQRGPAFGRAARSAVALEAWRAFSAPFRGRCGRVALAHSPRGSVRSSALAAHHAPRRTCRSSPAELPRRLCLRSDR